MDDKIISPHALVWLPVDDNDDMSLSGDYIEKASIKIVNWFAIVLVFSRNLLSTKLAAIAFHRRVFFLFESFCFI